MAVNEAASVGSAESTNAPLLLFRGSQAPHSQLNLFLKIFIGISLDISEQKEAELAKFASKRILRSVIDNVPQLIFWKDLQSRYLGCNVAYAKVNRPSVPKN